MTAYCRSGAISPALYFSDWRCAIKKLINNVADVVNESLAGMLAAHDNLIEISLEPLFITRKNVKQNKVALLAGGGSGHEPMHNGFVGYGMLDAACPGEIFTSPTPDQIVSAAKKVHSGSGVLCLIKNYTGDVLNFKMATDLCEAEDIPTDSVIIDDDVAVNDSLYTAGRRGVGGTVLIEKICGAKAESTDSLKAVADLARKCNANVRSIGMALTSCTVPAVGKPTFEIGDDEIEMGVGIHGEPGRTRMKIKPVNELVDMMMDYILTDLPFKTGDESIALLNGMGGTPIHELYIAYAQLVKVAEARGLKIVRNLVGNYITALDMQGFSITILKADQEMLSLWDAPVHTPGMRWGM